MKSRRRHVPPRGAAPGPRRRDEPPGDGHPGTDDERRGDREYTTAREFLVDQHPDPVRPRAPRLFRARRRFNASGSAVDPSTRSRSRRSSSPSYQRDVPEGPGGHALVGHSTTPRWPSSAASSPRAGQSTACPVHITPRTGPLNARGRCRTGCPRSQSGLALQAAAAARGLTRSPPLDVPGQGRPGCSTPPLLHNTANADHRPRR